MKNDLWRLLITNINDCADITGQPQSSAETITNAIDKLEQVQHGLICLHRLDEVDVVIFISTYEKCDRLRIQLKEQLKELSIRA